MIFGPALSRNTLRVTGERKEEKEEKGKTYHRAERDRGSFARANTLPCAVKDDKANAECHDGVPTISLPKTELPKTEEAKTHKIKVKTNGKSIRSSTSNEREFQHEVTYDNDDSCQPSLRPQALAE